MFIVDTDGNLLYYGAWTRLFTPTDESENPLMPESLPLMIALTELRPNYGTMWLRGYDDVRRHIGVTAFPIMESNGENIGAMAIYWEIQYILLKIDYLINA